MTERNPTPAPATLVAIDIAKHRHEVLIEAPGHQRRRRLTILSNKAEHDRLVAALPAYASPVLIGFEATGDYHRGARLPPALGRLRAAAGLIRGARPDAGGSAQRLGQERPQGRAGDPAHAPDRRDPALSRPAGGRDQRPAGAVEDPRGDLEGQDRDLASHPDPLPAAVFSRDRALCRQQPQRLVPRLARTLSHAWPASWLWTGRALCRRHGPSSAARCPKRACSTTSTRPHAPPQLCPWQKALRRSPCSAWCWPRPAA